MRINHCGLQIGVSQEFLNCSYIISIFKKMCGKTMAQRMNRCLLSCPCLNSRFLKCPLQRCGVLMMTADDAASRVNKKRFCRKEPKPAPLFPCIRIFFLKGAGLIEYCHSHAGHEDVLRLCEEYVPRDRDTAGDASSQDAKLGFVFLV